LGDTEGISPVKIMLHLASHNSLVGITTGDPGPNSTWNNLLKNRLVKENPKVAVAIAVVAFKSINRQPESNVTLQKQIAIADCWKRLTSHQAIAWKNFWWV